MEYKIYNEDCFETMKRIDDGCIDIVLTSPFYNTSQKAGKSRTLSNINVSNNYYEYLRYDSFVDNMTNEEYLDFTVRLFNNFDRIISKNGCVLYNMSYGSENTECMFLTINAILTRTNFTIADTIIWKKPIALPNNVSSNKLTRIIEFVFVFCRKDEIKTFNCNKGIIQYRKTGQAVYNNVYNFIEAKNNDGQCPINKATYSSELCEKLLNIYAVYDDTVVYDPFMGSGTTAVACKKMGFNCIGSEISENQVKWANERLEKVEVEVVNNGEVY